MLTQIIIIYTGFPRSLQVKKVCPDGTNIKNKKKEREKKRKDNIRTTDVNFHDLEFRYITGNSVCACVLDVI